MRELRVAVVTMSATLASYGSALALKHAVGLDLDVVVLAVVLALSLSRTERRSGRRERIAGVVLLPVVAIAASEVGSLLARDPSLGDALFSVAVSGSIWLRRFGAGFARAGTLITLPFVALLVAPAVPGSGHPDLLWAGVIGVIAYFWVAVAYVAAERSGFLSHATAGVGAPTRTRAPGRALAASSRMAIQMAVALAAAFAVGRTLFGVHWSWLVMTAFVVCSGNRGRADVVYKSFLRVAGAAGGTVAATLIAGALPPGDVVSVVLIFTVLAVAGWLRAFSYAYWACGVTAVLALLYGYFGESGTAVLGQRLEGIAVGALIAIAASWLILPVRTADVLRRRTADALAALSGVLAAMTATPEELEASARRFEHAVAALDEIAKPLEAHRMLTARGSPRPHGAHAIDAARRCRAAVARVVESSASEPDVMRAPAVAERTAALAAALRRTRRGLAGKAVAAHPPKPAGGAENGLGAGLPGLELALSELEASVARFATGQREHSTISAGGSG